MKNVQASYKKENLMAALRSWGPKEDVQPDKAWGTMLVWNNPYQYFAGTLLDAEQDVNPQSLHMSFQVKYRKPEIIEKLEITVPDVMPTEDFINRVLAMPEFIAKRFGLQSIIVHDIDKHPIPIQNVFYDREYQLDSQDMYRLDL